MKKLLTRRSLVTGGLSAAAGIAGVGAANHFAGGYGLIPPDGNGVLGIGKTLTYASQRLLTAHQPLAREFSRSELSSVTPVNGRAPEDAKFQALKANGFRDWRLTIEGAVARPMSLSLDDLKAMPSENRILLHACEEGWSYIAEWTGVRLSAVLDLVGTRPEARYVVLHPFPNASNNTGIVRVSVGSIDMADALHPQTLLAYGMNGQPIPDDHGAPLRLRMSRQLGFKNTKYISRIVVAENGDFFRAGNGTWYGGI
jgi:DMSO/TMAO reductase YedYZ molybdopterin-dependent catalytic subunit